MSRRRPRTVTVDAERRVLTVDEPTRCICGYCPSVCPVHAPPVVVLSTHWRSA